MIALQRASAGSGLAPRAYTANGKPPLRTGSRAKFTSSRDGDETMVYIILYYTRNLFHFIFSPFSVYMLYIYIYSALTQNGVVTTQRESLSKTVLPLYPALLYIVFNNIACDNMRGDLITTQTYKSKSRTEHAGRLLYALSF